MRDNSASGAQASRLAPQIINNKKQISMVSEESIKEVFEYYNVQSEVDSNYGNWVVSTDADVINVEKKYPIYTHQVKSGSLDSWLDHMRKKTWFSRSEEEDFRKAYERAQELLS